MVTRPQYILAKYIPEVRRNEPRNIGVILWTQWGITARFLGEENGLLDGRKAPGWIESWQSYREWINHWRTIMRRGHFASRNVTRVSSDSVGFLDALTKTSKANYLLSDKGLILEDVERYDCGSLLNFLFETLVEPDSDKPSAKNAYDIERECNRIIRRTSAIRHDHFYRGKSVLCPIASDVIEEFAFDYYVGNGVPELLYQRVPLGGRRMDTALNATAWQFEQVIKQKIITKDSSAAIIMPTQEQREDERVQRAISILRTQTRVFDLPLDAEIFAEEIDKSLEKHP